MVSPGGNHGDTLIHMGMVKVLEKARCIYQCLNLREAYRQRRLIGVKYLMNRAVWKLGMDRAFNLFEIPRDVGLILFEGGGYMNDIWYGLKFLKHVLRKNKQPIAIAAQSYWFKDTPIMSFFTDKRKVTLFCRERYSLDLLSKMPKPSNVSVNISRDPALYLERQDLKDLINPSQETYELVCLRNDRESIIPQRMKRKIIERLDAPFVSDISKKGRLCDYVSIIANASSIFTDRLHVAILAHILGKETKLYDNCYHKNRGVYDHSLKQNPKITLIELE